MQLVKMLFFCLIFFKKLTYLPFELTQWFVRSRVSKKFVGTHQNIEYWCFFLERANFDTLTLWSKNCLILFSYFYIKMSNMNILLRGRKKSCNLSSKVSKYRNKPHWGEKVDTPNLMSSFGEIRRQRSIRSFWSQ